MKGKLTIAFLVIGISATGLATPTITNLWSLATGRGFFIPNESSVFSFQMTKENEGSGEWWLYGEDKQHFFALHEKEPLYLVFPRKERERCPGFLAADRTTWCPAYTIRVPHE